MKQILVINFGGLGDEILFLPCLEAIKNLYPDSLITLLVEPRSRGIMDLTDSIDNLLTFDIKKKPLLIVDLIELVGLLRQRSYDMVVSSGSSIVVSILLFLSGIKVRVGYNTSTISNLLLTHKAKLNTNQYASFMYYSLAEALGASSVNNLVPRLKIKNLNIEKKKKPYLLIHPGASKLSLQKGIDKTYKHWSKFIEQLCNKLPEFDIVLTGGPEDGDVINVIKNEVSLNSNFKIIFGDFQLINFLSLVNSSNLFICLDSAPMHMAVGLNKKLLALFGPTQPEKLIPNQENFIVGSLNSSPEELVQIVMKHL